MKLAIDPFCRATAYADVRDDETLTDELRERALERARELGAEHVEFWRAPYGYGPDRMAGFVELARVPSSCLMPHEPKEGGSNYVPR